MVGVPYRPSIIPAPPAQPVQPNDFVLELSEPVVPTPRGRDLSPVANDYQLDGVIPQDPANMGVWERFAAYPFMRGLTQLGQTADTLKAMTGNIDPAEFANRIEDADLRMQQFPQHPDDAAVMQRAKDAGGAWEGAGVIATNPQLWAQAVVQSLPMMAAPAAGALGGGAVGGAVAGPVGATAGAMTGTFAASYLQEFGTTVLDVLKSKGIEGSEADLAKAIQDPIIMGEAKEYALKRGLPVAAFDAITMGIAGKTFKVIETVAEPLGPVVSKTLGGAAETVVQSTGGVLGEGGGQLASEGKFTSAADMALEGFAEVPGAIIDPLVSAPGQLLGRDKAATDAARPENLPIMRGAEPTVPAVNPNEQIVNPNDFVLDPLTPPANSATQPVPVGPVTTQGSTDTTAPQTQQPGEAAPALSPEPVPSTPAEGAPAGGDAAGPTEPVAAPPVSWQISAGRRPTYANGQGRHTLNVTAPDGRTVQVAVTAPNGADEATINALAQAEAQSRLDMAARVQSAPGGRPAPTPEETKGRLDAALAAIAAEFPDPKTKQWVNEARTKHGQEDETEQQFRIGDRIKAKNWDGTGTAGARHMIVVGVTNGADGPRLTAIWPGAGINYLAASNVGEHIRGDEPVASPTEPETAPPVSPVAPTPNQPLAAPPTRRTGSLPPERVVTPDGEYETDTEFEVVDADELRAAQGQLQPRDRLGRQESDAQILHNARTLDPLRLLQSRESDRGAPIIDPTNTILSGNGRVQSILLAQRDHPERYEAYRSKLRELGYDVDSVRTPVLVRRASNVKPEDMRRFTTRSNMEAGQALSAPELARIEADYLTPTMMASYNTEVEEGVSAAANTEFVRQFVASMPQAQRNAVMTSDGRLSEQGAKRISNAIFARAYGDQRLIDRATETNADPAIRNALTAAAAGWATMRDENPSFDITPELVEAVGLLNEAKGKNLSIAQFLAQADAFRQISPRSAQVLRLFQNRTQTRLAAWKDIRDRLLAFSEAARTAAMASGDMLGDRPGPDQVLAGIVRGIDRNDDPDPAAPGAKAQAGGNELFPTGQVLSLPPKNGRRKAAKATPGDDEGFLDEAEDIDAEQLTDEEREFLGPNVEADADGNLFINRPGFWARRHDVTGGLVQDDQGDEFVPGKRSAFTKHHNGKQLRTVEEVRAARRQTGALAPKTEDVSFSKGPAKWEDAWRLAGLTPDEGQLLTPVEKRAVLARVFRDKFGFAGVSLNDGNGARIGTVTAMNQILDAVHNVHFMAHVLGLPLDAIGLDGTLSMSLEQDLSRYFGVYRPADRTIGLPGRSNSFAHEWAHALDHFLAGRTKGRDQLLSQLTRGEGLDPTQSLDAAYIDLIHSLFFEQGSVALAALELERQAGAVIQKGPNAGKPTAAALEARAKLTRLLSGATRLKLPPSQFRDGSIKFVPGSDYWPSVHEMIARSFEAFVAHKVEAAGGDNAFVSKGDSAYRSDADRRLAMTFPKGDERLRIFSAWDNVFHHLRNQAVLGTANPAELPDDTDLLDPQHWHKLALQQKPGTIAGSFQSEAVAVATKARNIARNGIGAEVREGLSEFRQNLGVSDPKNLKGRRLLSNFADKIRVPFFNLRGATNPLIKRNKGKGAEAMQALWDKVATQHGAGTAIGQTYEEAVERGKNGALTIANDIDAMLRHHKRKKIGAQDNDTIRELLFGAKVAASDELKSIAAGLRRIMDRVHTYATDSGVDMGYVEEKGYLPRVLDTRKVQLNPADFIKDAEKVYRIVYDRLVKSIKPGDLVKLAENTGRALDPTGRAAMFETEIEAVEKASRALDKALAKFEADQEQSKKPGGSAPDPALRQAVRDAAKVLDQAMTDLKSVLRDPYATVAAQHYFDRIAIGDSTTFDSVGPQADFTKERTLPGEADELLKDWYQTDVLDLVLTYSHSAAKRAAFVQRFGTPGGNRNFSALASRKDVLNHINANPDKYDIDTVKGRVAIIEDLANRRTDNVMELLLNQAVQAGADGNDLTILRGNIVDITGHRRNSVFGGVFDGIMGKLTFLGYLMLLSKAAWTSLSEPATVIMRTRNFRSGIVTFADYLGEAVAFASKDTQMRRELARAIGLTNSALMDTVLMNRLGAEYGHVHSANISLSRFFRSNLLAGLTNAQRRATMSGGHFWMRDLARQLQGKKIGPAQAERVRAEFRELGVPAEAIDDFATWLLSSDELPGLEHLDTKAGQVWQTAIGRFTDQVIQNPRRADKPILAATPLGRVVYMLTSFLYSFYQNVNVAYYNRFKRDFGIAQEQGSGKIGAAAFAAADTLKGLGVGFTMLFAANLLTTIAREALLNGEQWEKRRKEGELEGWLASLAFSRTGILGPLDVIKSTLDGVRYERDLTGLFTGPGVSYMLSNVQNILVGMGLTGRNSPNNNTAERNAWKAVYRLSIAPLATWLLTAFDTAGPVGAFGKWVGMVNINSNNSANAFADTLAGKPNAKKKTED